MRRSLLVSLLAAVCGIAIAACGSTNSKGSSGANSAEAKVSSGATTASPGKAISAKIGLVDDVTGDLAFVGVEQQRAAKLAIADVNKTAGGVHLEAIAEDSKSEASGSVTAVEALMSNSEVSGIVGFDETEFGEAVLPLLAKAGLPTVMLQVTVLKNRPANVFTMAPPTSRVAKLAVEEVVVKRGVKSAGIIWVEQPTLTEAAETFKQALQAAKVSVVADEGATLTTTNFQSQVAKVVAAKPEAIGISGVGTQDGTILSELREYGYHGLVFAQQAADSTITRKVAGAAFAGLIVGTYWDEAAADASAKRFLAAYKQAYPSEPPPDVYAVEAWDAVHIMAEAMKRAGSTEKTKVVEEIAKGSFPGALQKSISFDSSGVATLGGYVVEMTAHGTKLLASATSE